MSVEQKIIDAKKIYDTIIYLEKGINNDSEHNQIKLIENDDAIFGTIEIYYNLLELVLLPNFELSDEISHYYHDGKKKLTDIEEIMKRISP
jgi:hypothetical protein